METNDQVLTELQGAIHRLHGTMEAVKGYIKNNGSQSQLATLDIDYGDPEQEFYIRIFLEFEQIVKMTEMAMEYVDRPIRKTGRLNYLSQSGVYLVGSEQIKQGDMLEFMSDGRWEIGRVHFDKVRSTYELLNIRGIKYDVEMDGLKVRLR